MSKVILRGFIKAGDRDVAMLLLDVDPNASRVAVHSRASMNLLKIVKPIAGVGVEMIIPLKYATTETCTVTIIDDSLEFANVMVDGVSAQLVKASDV
ncbi:hypothetical protein NVP1083O_35 [Vibrio phage 1.083.O._10N.286.52.B9]|nr:hypothetical protein NVP1083O_35 [Vibrio phage 1.083.O._10N.286.52.B9]